MADGFCKIKSLATNPVQAPQSRWARLQVDSIQNFFLLELLYLLCVIAENLGYQHTSVGA